MFNFARKQYGKNNESCKIQINKKSKLKKIQIKKNSNTYFFSKVTKQITLFALLV